MEKLCCFLFWLWCIIAWSAVIATVQTFPIISIELSVVILVSASLVIAGTYGGGFLSNPYEPDNLKSAVGFCMFCLGIISFICGVAFVLHINGAF